MGRLRVRRGSLLCLHTRLPFSESSAGPPTTSLLRPEGFIAQKRRDAGSRRGKAQRMSDAKPRTSLRSYWHTPPKKKEQTPLKTGVRYNKKRPFPSTFSRSRTWTLPLIQLPASKQLAFLMKVWMNRHQFGFADHISKNMHDQSIPFTRFISSRKGAFDRARRIRKGGPSGWG